MTQSIVSMFYQRAKQHPEKLAILWNRKGEWQHILWKEYRDHVYNASYGLLGLGFKNGDKANIIGINRPEWFYSDLAILSNGGISVPVYHTNTPKQIEYISQHSDASVIFLENKIQLEKVLSIKSNLPSLKKIIIWDNTEIKDPMIMPFSELELLGEKIKKEQFNAIEKRVNEIRLDDIATIVYTSGTTGPPKGAMISHSNIVWTCEALTKANDYFDTDMYMSYLPLSHIAERIGIYYSSIFTDGTVGIPESLDKLAADIKVIQPHIMFAVPRVMEKFYAGIKVALSQTKGFKKKIINFAINTGNEWVKNIERGKPASEIPPLLKLKRKIADKLVYSKLKHELGFFRGRLLIAGGAPVPPEILRFFHSINIPLCVVYGQTEVTGPTSIHEHGNIKFDTAGPPVPGVEVKIAQDGEILVKGGNVFVGYFKNPEATAEALKDGWLYSGDIGEFDSNGHLKVTDRKKDIIITSGGKNISPSNIESIIKSNPLISQVVVIGDKKPYLTALITLNIENAQKFAKEKGIHDTNIQSLSKHPEINKAISEFISKVNDGLAKYETIKRFTILERDFTQDADELTPTLKVKRKVVTERYAAIIDSMYNINDI
ncbi:MAG: AMP-dependent synthetase/ligase [bacterium]